MSLPYMGKDGVLPVPETVYLKVPIVASKSAALLLFSSFQVGPNSGNSTLQCLCNHLSAFGGDFLVAPNPIDFDKVWDAFSNIHETKNFLVLGTVCAIFGLYVIATVFARRADRNDFQKVSISSKEKLFLVNVSTEVNVSGRKGYVFANFSRVALVFQQTN